MTGLNAPGSRTGSSVTNAAVILVGIVVGTGIFRTPSLVAMQVESEAAFVGIWLLGGLVTLVERSATRSFRRRIRIAAGCTTSCPSPMDSRSPSCSAGPGAR
jgi:hypothetical protein